MPASRWIRGAVRAWGVLAAAASCTSPPTDAAPAPNEPSIAHAEPSANDQPVPGAERAPQEDRRELTNAGELGLSILFDAAASNAAVPSNGDILVAWGLVAREPAAAQVLEKLKDAGSLGFHVDALLCLSVIDDPAEFDRRFLALLEQARWLATDVERDGQVRLAPSMPLTEALSRVRRPAPSGEIDAAAVWTALVEGDAAAFRALTEESAASARLVGLIGLTRFDRQLAKIKLDAIRHVVGPLPDPSAPVTRRTWTWTGDIPPNPREFELSSAGRLAYHVLFATTTFSGSAVGEGGETPTPVRALRALLDERDAEAALGNLAFCGPMAARLYAACALKALASPTSEPTLAGLRQSRERVATLFGCIRAEAVVADLAKQIESGEMADIAGR